MEKKDKVAEILLRHKILNEKTLSEVDREIQKTDLSFSQALEKLGIIKEEELAQLLAQEMGVPFVDLSHYLIDPEVIKLMPQKTAKKFKALPLFKVGKRLTVAMVNPKDVMALDEIRQITGNEEIEVVASTGKMISKIIEDVYGKGKEMEDVLKNIEPSATIEGTTIIEMVNLLVIEAVRDRASDIHLEPNKDGLRVRYRIDGILHETNTFPKHFQNAVIVRVKLIANMDIAESRFPQDGKVEMKIEGKDLDIRVSTFPTVDGENIVMRILDKSSVIMGLDQLGLLEEDLAKFEHLIRQPFGMFLLTGPTGSGKTTSLYAILSAINSIEKNIVTIEDPVEYQLPLIRQTQVNPKAGLTFVSELRAVLRQDPDIIMVGEIRDTETAEVSIRAALTGHMVFSTLHTNNASSALARMLDMEIEPFLVSSTVVGVVAQRLVRIICEHCKERYTPSKDILKSLEMHGIDKFYRGKGCKACENTGFLGRKGLFELLVMDQELKKMVLRRVPSEEIQKVAVDHGMRTLYQDGIEKVKRGITTIEEVLRVAKEFD